MNSVNINFIYYLLINFFFFGKQVNLCCFEIFIEDMALNINFDST